MALRRDRQPLGQSEARGFRAETPLAALLVAELVVYHWCFRHRRRRNSRSDRTQVGSGNYFKLKHYQPPTPPVGLQLSRAHVMSDLGFPGEFPFTRGIQPTMYRGRLWTMRQYAGFGTAAESNARYRYLLEQGVNGLSVAFDLPTQMGYDSDHALAQGEVGRVGVAIDSIEDMALLFDCLLYTSPS